MKRPLLAYVVLSLVLLTALPVHADPPSDQGVLNALSTAIGHRVVKRNVAIRRSLEFPHVISIGMYRVNHGYELTGLFVDKRYGDPRYQTRPGLASVGWKTASASVRRTLALAWVEKVLLAFDVFEDAPDAAFHAPHAHPFSPPVAESTARGGVDVTMWVREPSTSTESRTLCKWRYQFKPDGSLHAMHEIDRFTVSFSKP